MCQNGEANNYQQRVLATSPSQKSQKNPNCHAVGYRHRSIHKGVDIFSDREHVRYLGRVTTANETEAKKDNPAVVPSPMIDAEDDPDCERGKYCRNRPWQSLFPRQAHQNGKQN